MFRTHASLAATLGALAVAACVGCGQADPASRIQEINSSNLLRLTNIYLAFQLEHQSQGPKDEQDLKAFVASVPRNKLERIGVDPSDIDGVFLSERDGQPFRVRYGVRGSTMGSKEPVVFEAEGKSDKRLVGFLNMTSREVEADEYERLWSEGAST